MRKLSLALLALLFSAPVMPATAAPAVAAGAGQFGFIDWIEMNGSKGTIVGIVADRFVDPDSGVLVTVAGVFRGACKKSSSGGWTMISCSARGRGKQIAHEDFSVDPTLASARVKLTIGGQTHTGTWTGRGPAPYTFAGAGTDSQWFGAGAGMARDCKGNGRVFGKKRVTRSWMDWAYLEQGAGVAAYTGGDLDVNFRDGQIFVRKTVRIAN
ncbi:MAG: hypothetical protein M3285_07600 [Actinomycetota bacterium]|nr:hypothetical protein [Actinomycetota bacterium]